MNVYIITDNYYFFLGMKQELDYEPSSIFRIDPERISQEQTDLFRDDDIYIFFIENNTLEFSAMLLSQEFPGRSLHIPKHRRARPAIKRTSPLYEDLDVNYMISKMNDEFEGRFKDMTQLKNTLTERERVILFHIMEGLSVRSISHILSISEKTVYSHKKRAFSKLGGRNLFEILPLNLGPGSAVNM